MECAFVDSSTVREHPDPSSSNGPILLGNLGQLTSRDPGAPWIPMRFHRSTETKKTSRVFVLSPHRSQAHHLDNLIKEYFQRCLHVDMAIPDFLCKRCVIFKRMPFLGIFSLREALCSITTRVRSATRFKSTVDVKDMKRYE